MKGIILAVLMFFGIGAGEVQPAELTPEGEETVITETIIEEATESEFSLWEMQDNQWVELPIEENVVTWDSADISGWG